MEKILKDFKNKEWSAEVYGIGNTTFYSPYEVNVIFEGRKRNSSELIEKVHKFCLELSKDSYSLKQKDKAKISCMEKDLVTNFLQITSSYNSSLFQVILFYLMVH